MDFTLTFIRMFGQSIFLALPVLALLISLIIIAGQVAGRIEGWSRFDAFYWSFITATTVGYGDIRPVKRSTKVLSIVVAMIGLMFTGVFVAITVSTASNAFETHRLQPAEQRVGGTRNSTYNIRDVYHVNL